jgi:hypothetical protein
MGVCSVCEQYYFILVYAAKPYDYGGQEWGHVLVDCGYFLFATKRDCYALGER